MFVVTTSDIITCGQSIDGWITAIIQKQSDYVVLLKPNNQWTKVNESIRLTDHRGREKTVNRNINNFTDHGLERSKLNASLVSQQL